MGSDAHGYRAFGGVIKNVLKLYNSVSILKTPALYTLNGWSTVCELHSNKAVIKMKVSEKNSVEECSR